MFLESVGVHAFLLQAVHLHAVGGGTLFGGLGSTRADALLADIVEDQNPDGEPNNSDTASINGCLCSSRQVIPLFVDRLWWFLVQLLVRS